MWEIIRRNKIKSVIAVSIMAVWYSLVYGFILSVFLFCIFIKTFGYEEKIIIYALRGSYYIGVAIALIIFIYIFLKKRNKPYDFGGYTMQKSRKSVNKQLHNIVEEIAIASGLNVIPNIYILNTKILNAYACGINPKNSSIVVSRGLLETLTRDELQGVIAHEMGHIVNRDTTYLLCSGIMYSISASFTYHFYESAKSGGRGAGMMFLLGLISSLGEAICFLLLMFVSRKREYMADASACIYTRYPKGLADALLKIEQSYENPKSIISVMNDENKTNCLLKASFICPITEKKDGILSTHPSTTNRIKVLLNMKTADVIEYEKAFRKTNNNSKLFPKSIIKKTKRLPIREVIESSQPLEIAAACALGNIAVNEQEVKIIRANKDLLESNIEKHKDIQNRMYRLENYIIIDCECKTVLKIPPVYKNTVVICPHCKKKHAVGVKVN